MADSWKDRFWGNIFGSYLAAGVRVGTGLLLFPLLFRHLTQEQFGFWSLLWGIITYTILLDFGIGSTARVEVARRAHADDWADLNPLLSTMFWSYALVFTGVGLFMLSIGPWALHWIHADGNAEFRTAYAIFTIGISISVPLGLIFEILRGLQRIDLVLAWWSRGQLLNFALVCIGIGLHWSFAALMLVSVAATLSPLLGAWRDLRRLAPRLSLDPRLFKLSRLRPVLAFSLVAYLLSVANLLIARTDQIIISLCLGVSMVAVYQAGFKVAEVYIFGLSQLGELLTPAAAQSSGRRNKGELVDLLVKSTRVTALAAIPLFVLGLVFLEPLIHLLTGLSPVPAEYYAVGVILLIARFSSLLTHSCPCPVFLGAGYERKLLCMTVAQAVLTLGLSIPLALQIGVVGVALGSMIPALVIGWLWAVPLALQFTGMRFSQWVDVVYRPIAVPVLSSSLIALAGGAFWRVDTSLPGHAYLLPVAAIALASIFPVAMQLRAHLRGGLWATVEEEDARRQSPQMCAEPA